MKKIIVLFLLLMLNMNLCFATTKLSKEQIPEFKKDMEQAINNILNKPPELSNTQAATYKDFVVKTLRTDIGLYNEFVNDKNHMKRNSETANKLNFDCDLLIGLYGNLYTPFHQINAKYNLDWDKAIPWNEKYENIGGLWNIDTLEYINKKYIKKYKIRGEKELNDLMLLIIEAHNQIKPKAKEIENYGKQYETQKVDVFYKNSIAPKIRAIEPINIVPYLTHVRQFDKNLLYFANPKVVYILKHGFLADCIPGYNAIIFVRANDSYKLKYGDYFDPYIPIKFTGEYYTYTAMTGERKSVPSFTIALNAHKNITLPKIGEELYFIHKPNWDHLLKENSLSSLYVVNEQRIINNSQRSPYFRYR